MYIVKVCLVPNVPGTWKASAGFADFVKTAAIANVPVVRTHAMTVAQSVNLVKIVVGAVADVHSQWTRLVLSVSFATLVVHVMTARGVMPRLNWIHFRIAKNAQTFQL